MDEVEKAYRVLRSAEGKGGSASSEDGIDGLWRRSIALGLACATSAYRRAICNSNPRTATDTIPYYERCLGVIPPVEASETERREVVVAEWPAKASAIQRDIREQLKRIDSRFDIIQPNDSYSHVSHDGEVFGTWGISGMALFTTRYTLRVRFNVGHTPLTNTERTQLEQAKRKLRDTLPPFWGFTITTSTGFLCGVSPLGTTGVSH